MLKPWLAIKSQSHGKNRDKTVIAGFFRWSESVSILIFIYVFYHLYPSNLKGGPPGGGLSTLGGGLSTPFLQNMCHHVSTALVFPRGAPQVPLIAKSVKSWHWHQTAGVIIYKSGFYDIIIINKHFLISGS